MSPLYVDSHQLPSARSSKTMVIIGLAQLINNTVHDPVG